MKEKIAKVLLEKKAVTLNIDEPYTYVSGIRSPIYCDNRKMIAFPLERDLIVDGFIEKMRGVEFDVLAGTSTAGIPWASFVAQRMNKPMAYIRSGKKEHGKGQQIEGADVSGKKVIVIEDLVSTGGSSISAVEACVEAGAKVISMIAIFTYEFEKAKKKFEEGKCEAIFLSDFSTLANVAGNEGLLSDEKVKLVLEWNKDPAGWGPANGFPLGEKKV